MFIAAVFTVAKFWKQPICPTIDEWIKRMWYIYTIEFYSAIKMNEIILFAGKDRTGELHVKQSKMVSKSQRLHIFPHMCKVNL
jgi:hypothetical protein